MVHGRLHWKQLYGVDWPRPASIPSAIRHCRSLRLARRHHRRVRAVLGSSQVMVMRTIDAVHTPSSPLVGEGGLPMRSSGETGEGFLSTSAAAERSSHPAPSAPPSPTTGEGAPSLSI
jgi:hypothetical protein